MVGGWLVRSMLDEGADVVALVRDEPANCEFIRSGDWERVTRVRGDLTDDRLIARAVLDYEVEILFHLGAQSQVGLAVADPFGTMESNVRGTYTVLEAARAARHLKAIVIASSDKAYGASNELPYRESHPLAGRGIYDASKSAADTIATAYALSFDLPLLIARCGNIYGGGDLNWERLIPGTIRSLLLGQQPIIRSDGRARRDYVFVDDAVGAYRTLGRRRAVWQASRRGIQLRAGQPVTVDEVVRELMRQTGRTDLAAGHSRPSQRRDPRPIPRRFEGLRAARMAAVIQPG